MRTWILWSVLAWAGGMIDCGHARRHFETHDYYALHLRPRASPSEVAAELGLQYEGPLGELPDHHVFFTARDTEDIVKNAIQTFHRTRRKRDLHDEGHILNDVLLSRKQVPRRRLFKRMVLPSPERRSNFWLPSRESASQRVPVDSTIMRQREIAGSLDINDPIFPEQWHLFNPVQLGHDINVTGLWSDGITGKGSIVAIVDDGIDMYSEDLKDNYFAEGSYDFNDHGLEPRPRLSDDKHGTRCAGEIAAVKNNVCGVGVAWDAKVAGLRILSDEIPDADEAVAMNYAYQSTQIYSCSWGPPDDGEAMDAPGILIRRAMINGVQNGRHGKGSIYVFASGNGAAKGDNCNFDGYTNSIYSITVGAIDRKGLHPYYSEQCSAHLVVTYSSGSGDAIHTTDVGANKCNSQHGGTSAAAPLAAGIFALVLSVRPDLGWRDLQYLTMQTAVPVNLVDGQYQTTSIGKQFSHKYGYGKLDAWAIVEAAKDFESVKPQGWYHTPLMHVDHEIPEGEQGLANTVEITEDDLQKANLERLEHVTVNMNVEHARRGDISVELHSPAGIVSFLSVARKHDKSTYGYVDWTFMTVAHWGESGRGNWTVIVKDTQVNHKRGTFKNWKMTLWGESLDEAKATPFPMPMEDEDDENHATETVSVSTTRISTDGSHEPTITVNPSDHPDRPVNAKPSDGAGSAPPATASEPAKSDHVLPSFFPTFGVSKRTQIWIYGALAIIVLFCAGIGTYLFLARRKRLRNNVRDDYEFEVLDDQEDVDGTNVRKGRRQSRTRGGELYDAFAEESDDELFPTKQEKYRDRHDEEAESAGAVVLDDDDDDDDDDPADKDDRQGLLLK